MVDRETLIADAEATEEMWSETLQDVLDDDKTEKQDGNWEPYEGPRGGEGWRNVETDEVVYQDEPPGETVDGVEPEFEPAESMEEAVEYAEQNLANSADFGEMDLEVVNRVNETLSELIVEDGLPRIDTIEYKPDMDRHYSARYSGGSIKLSDYFAEPQKGDRVILDAVNRGVVEDKTDAIRGDIEYLQQNIEQMRDRMEDEEDEDLRDRMQENIERYQSQIDEREEQLRDRLRYDPDRHSATTTQEDTIVHEYGHHIGYSFGEGMAPIQDWIDAIEAFNIHNIGSLSSFGWGAKKDAAAISEYATTNPAEYIAEAFTAYRTLEHERLTDEVIDFFDDVMESKYSDALAGAWN